jgi:fructose-1,6-bisphosphatase I
MVNSTINFALFKAITSAAAKTKSLLHESSVDLLNDSKLLSQPFYPIISNIKGTIDDIFIEELHNSFSCAGVASTNLQTPLLFPNSNSQYVATIDALNGFDNFKYGGLVGSIFSFYKIQDSKATELDFLQPGNEIIFAGYVLYGPTTILVTANKFSVTQYQLINNKFIHNKSKLSIPKTGGIVTANHSDHLKWSDGMQEWHQFAINYLQYKSHYTGTLVADAHRILLQGGIFAAPEEVHTKKMLHKLLYECNPMAYIFSRAQGVATNGYESVLTIQPESFHQKSSFIFGSIDDVVHLQRFCI